MKLQTVKEVTDRKQAEIAKDIARTTQVKEALEKVTKELNESEARFSVALANQRVRWSYEEEKALDRLKSLNKEIEMAEEVKKTSLIPIEEREQKSYALFTQAEVAFKDADIKRGELDSLKAEEEILIETLEEKIDSLTEREQSVSEREQKVLIKEKSLEEERDMIRKLSAELSIKLQNFK